jgi:hypothetical protein
VLCAMAAVESPPAPDRPAPPPAVVATWLGLVMFCGCEGARGTGRRWVNLTCMCSN